jgi:uncharacterized protein (TIGR02118 family)
MLYQSINPYTEELIRTFPQHTDGDIESIIAAAEKTYATDWSSRSLAERKAVIKRAASILRDRHEEFAKLTTLDMGKLLREARAEVALCADILDYFADFAGKFLAPNDSPYGLGATVITQDIERGKRVPRQIESGMAFINEVTTTAPELPFGGVKNSGQRHVSERARNSVRPRLLSNEHMPLIKRRMGTALRYYTVDKGLSGATPDAPPTYIGECHLLCDSLEAYHAAFDPHAEELFGDIRHFTDQTPVVQMSEVVVENSNTRP